MRAKILNRAVCTLFVACETAQVYVPFSNPQLTMETMVYETAMVCLGLVEYVPPHACGIRFCHGISIL
jgi:hypothetical protein